MSSGPIQQRYRALLRLAMHPPGSPLATSGAVQHPPRGPGRQNGTQVRSSPSCGARPDIVRQNPMASARRPTPPWPAWNAPPAGPVSSIPNGRRCRLAQSPPPVVLRRDEQVAPDGPAEVDAVHPGVAEQDDVDEVADGPHRFPGQLRVVGCRPPFRGERPSGGEHARHRLVQSYQQLGGGEVGVLADLQGGQLGEPQLARLLGQSGRDPELPAQLPWGRPASTPSRAGARACPGRSTRRSPSDAASPAGTTCRPRRAGVRTPPRPGSWRRRCPGAGSRRRRR